MYQVNQISSDMKKLILTFGRFMKKKWRCGHQARDVHALATRKNDSLDFFVLGDPKNK